MSANDFAIDFVMPWVDDSDPKWQAEYRKYRGDQDSDGQAAVRFRNWDTLRYWFRGVEKYAPWVHKIFFVTCGQRPEWLNIDHPKLQLIDHKDYIPEKYLPVFSSHPIELNLHRIPELSEHFVYFNDDIFITAPLSPDDFWKNGKPREMAVEYPLYANQEDSFSHILLNMSRVLNMHFSKRAVQKASRKLWWSPVYGKYLLNNLCMSRFGTFSGLITPHIPSALEKTKMERVWGILEKELDSTCTHRFRSPEDINQYIFRFWNIVEGNFYPVNFDTYTKFVALNDQCCDDLGLFLQEESIKLLCLNDSSQIKDPPKVKQQIKQAFDVSFPKQSAFEKGSVRP